MKTAEESYPSLESENQCSKCNEPQIIPLSVPDDLCWNCWVFLERMKK